MNTQNTSLLCYILSDDSIAPATATHILYNGSFYSAEENAIDGTISIRSGEDILYVVGIVENVNGKPAKLFASTQFEYDFIQEQIALMDDDTFLEYHVSEDSDFVYFSNGNGIYSIYWQGGELLNFTSKKDINAFLS